MNSRVNFILKDCSQGAEMETAPNHNPYGAIDILDVPAVVASGLPLYISINSPLLPSHTFKFDPHSMPERIRLRRNLPC